MTQRNAIAPAVAIEPARESDAAELAQLHAAVARDLTARYGKGHWSSEPSERGILRGIESSLVLVARDPAAREGGAVVATLRLVTKKPWAIDVEYFTPVTRPLYLIDMAVLPARQRTGLGRKLMDAARDATRAWPSGGIRLDAYDSPAGAGPFYAKCGMRERGRVTYRGVPLVYFESLVG